MPGFDRQHLSDLGKMIVHIDHQDPAWLGGLPIKPEGAFGDASELRLSDGGVFRTMKRWSYDRATQTAALAKRIGQTDAAGVMVDTAARGPVRMHGLSHYEMELLLERAGSELQALYGDFSRGSLTHESGEMIWVVSRRLRSAIRDRRAPAGI